MRDAESFVKVEVAGIDSKFAWATDADKGVQVGSIHIDLAARLVDLFADVAYRCFVDTVSRWVSDHSGGNSGSMFFQFGV
jgi:hypothetical protein